MRVAKIIGVVLSVFLSTLCFAEYRQPVNSIKPLLLDAIKYGDARGILQGKLADILHKKYNTTQPILVDVKVLGDYPQKGCKRLQVSIKQDGVIEAAGKAPTTKETSYPINFCASGDFPQGKDEKRVR